MQNAVAKIRESASMRSGSSVSPSSGKLPATPSGADHRSASAATGSASIHAPRRRPRSSGTGSAPRISRSAGLLSIRSPLLLLVVVLVAPQHPAQLLRRQDKGEADHETEDRIEAEPALEREMRGFDVEQVGEQQQPAHQVEPVDDPPDVARLVQPATIVVHRASNAWLTGPMTTSGMTKSATQAAAVSTRGTTQAGGASPWTAPCGGGRRNA